MWTLRGLVTRVPTTPYPGRPDPSPGVTPGRPITTRAPQALAEVCPTGALRQSGESVEVDIGRCIACMRCRRRTPEQMQWQEDFAWAKSLPDGGFREGAFRHSLHVRVVDAGDCGACLAEIRQLTGPYYAMHRLGIFITPTPRDADVLLVVGPVTHATRYAVQEAYAAIPEPKRVMAVGSAAVTGVPFGPSFASAGGVGTVLPVAMAVPGCPPPPLAILDALLGLMGRTPAGRAKAGAADR